MSTRPTLRPHLRLAALALGAATLLPASAMSAIESFRGPDVQPRGWSAVAGSDTASVIEMAATLPAGDMAEGDTPYCDADPAIARTLSQDFGESLVEGTRIAGNDAQLWGSHVLGTWTLVLARPDATSCIVASGIGYRDSANPDIYYAKAGLEG